MQLDADMVDAMAQAIATSMGAVFEAMDDEAKEKYRAAARAAYAAIEDDIRASEGEAITDAARYDYRD
jgi:hypothetical protein